MKSGIHVQGSPSACPLFSCIVGKQKRLFYVEYSVCSLPEDSSMRKNRFRNPGINSNTKNTMSNAVWITGRDSSPQQSMAAQQMSWLQNYPRDLRWKLPDKQSRMPM